MCEKPFPIEANWGNLTTLIFGLPPKFHLKLKLKENIGWVGGGRVVLRKNIAGISGEVVELSLVRGHIMDWLDSQNVSSSPSWGPGGPQLTLCWSFFLSLAYLTGML